MRQKKREKNARWRFVTMIPRPVTGEWSLRASDIDSHHRKSLGTFRRMSGNARKTAGVTAGRLLMWTIILSHANWVHTDESWYLALLATAGAGLELSQVFWVWGTLNGYSIADILLSKLSTMSTMQISINLSGSGLPDNKLDYILSTMSLLNSWFSEINR